MVQVIYGKKGSGKTKRLIAMANEDAVNAKGNVVFVDNDKDYMIDVKRPVRFVLATEYGIKNDDMLYGFLSGALSQNYDIEAIYVDALVRITQKTAEQLEGFFNCLEKLGEEHNVKFVLNVCADTNEAPEYLKKYII